MSTTMFLVGCGNALHYHHPQSRWPSGLALAPPPMPLYYTIRVLARKYSVEEFPYFIKWTKVDKMLLQLRCSVHAKEAVCNATIRESAQRNSR